MNDAPAPAERPGSALLFIHRDARLLAVNKPPGLPVHEAHGPGKSLLRILREEEGLTGWVPAHRLDKDASGVLLLVRREEAAAFERRWPEARKTYLGLSAGLPPETEGVISAPLLEHHTGKPERLANAVRYWRKMNPETALPALPAPRRTAVHPAGRPSETAYRVLETFGSGPAAWCWLEIRPRQGRMHQIRVHLAQAGFPLAGDPWYGRPNATTGPAGLGTALLPRLPLHAWRLELPDPAASGRILAFEAPEPEDLLAALARLRASAPPS